MNSDLKERFAWTEECQQSVKDQTKVEQTARAPDRNDLVQFRSICMDARRSDLVVQSDETSARSHDKREIRLDRGMPTERKGGGRENASDAMSTL